MNARIQELARRVVGQHRDAVGSVSLFDEQIEKFAQLIARECAQIAMLQHQSSSFDSYDDLNEYERGQDDTASTISGQIKQQFGLT